ncbi:hypothetical protein LCGC14_2067650, partial [marine sediment metagenome]
EHNNIVAVEQTSSGFEKIKNKAFAFPIINLARAYFKLNYEASFIASKIFDGIVCFLSKENKKMKNILLLGNGAVGKKLFLELNKYYNVTIADVKKEVIKVGKKGEKIDELLEEGIELEETDPLEETDLLEKAGFKEAGLAFQELAARVMSGNPLHGSTDWVSDTGDTL